MKPKYRQVYNSLIFGPGLPKQGAVSVGPAELDAAYQAGRDSLKVVCVHRTKCLVCPKDEE